jgi:rhamnogalacturonyl hydrolase YesR
LKNFSQEENENTNAIGLNTLIQQYQQTRQERYQEFLERWADLKEKDFRGNLLKIIENRSTTKIK